ncbi:acyl carrier protein [Candidatus Magnetaquicoccus inordinatus]|uniref:acyl carrier protein n=1 Tax=Candidatus Magnetaquicoccus inordinatus TaxID=2496818 RepID=UPI00102AD56F|nr:acyl carrier protein [Candidatus Magnetaquicoccus inordinatus]
MKTQRDKIVSFLQTVLRSSASIDRLQDHDNLVQAGYIDSLAMLEIVAFLEAEFAIDFSESGVNPVDLESIDAMLALIARSHSHTSKH